MNLYCKRITGFLIFFFLTASLLLFFSGGLIYAAEKKRMTLTGRSKNRKKSIRGYKIRYQLQRKNSMRPPKRKRQLPSK
jgi:hypothetical protein